MSHRIVKFCDLQLVIDQKTLIHHATGEICQGDKIALIGQSGSGKSLLLSLLADLTLPTKGQISLDGQPYHDITPSLLRQNIMLIHQQPAFIEGTVMDNLSLPFSFKAHQGQAFDKQWHLSQLAMFGKSDDFLTQDILDLSGGERQIVNFLRTLQFCPRILLLDEPTAALDETSADLLMQMVINWHTAQNGAFVWISHSSAQVNALKATIWRMQAGQLIMDAPKPC